MMSHDCTDAALSFSSVAVSSSAPGGRGEPLAELLGLQ